MAEASSNDQPALYVDCLTPFLERAERERLRAARPAGATLVRHGGRWMLLEPSALAPRAAQPAEVTDAELRVIAEHPASTDRDRALSEAERDRRYVERGAKPTRDLTAEDGRRLVAEYVSRFGAEDPLVQDVERFVCSTGRGIFDFYRTVRDAIESGETVSAERWEALQARAREQWPEDLLVCRYLGGSNPWLPVDDPNGGFLRKLRFKLLNYFRNS